MSRIEGRQGVIGGTGFSEKAQGFEKIRTDYGPVDVGHLDIGGRDVIFIARHQHLQIPSHVNYQANIEALKILKVNRVFTVSAAGRMHKDVLPGHLVNISGLDWDHTGNRIQTFAEDGALILHTPLSLLYNPELRDAINKSWSKSEEAIKKLYEPYPALAVGFHQDGTFYNTEAPWFNTEEREERIRNTVPNVKLIGQTSVPEDALLRELGISHAKLSMCTDNSNFPGAVPVEHAAEGGVMDAATVTSLAALILIDNAIRLIPDDFRDPVTESMFRGSIHPTQVDMKKLKKRRPKLAVIIDKVLASK